MGSYRSGVSWDVCFRIPFPVSLKEPHVAERSPAMHTGPTGDSSVATDRSHSEVRRTRWFSQSGVRQPTAECAVA